jgi:hypothetical protein
VVHQFSPAAVCSTHLSGGGLGPVETVRCLLRLETGVLNSADKHQQFVPPFALQQIFVAI